jgi:riboflavin kinase/FMN adenylyltransferase
MMKVIYGISKIRKFKKPVVTLGVFDGVHRAHRRILQETVRQAKHIRGTSVVVTFWPDPHKEDSLYSLEHRLRLIGELGIDICIVINFSRAFAKISAEDFIKNILIKKIGAHYIYVGKNFRFGKQAKGNFRILARLARIHNFKFKIFKVFKINHQPISSTYIRRLITKGDLKRAERLLSKPVTVLGTVIRGISLATRLGFPTANINPHHEVLPPSGVYAVKVILDNQRLKGVCYIGTKPTFKRKKEARHIEVYIFDFNKNIYKEFLEIQFIQKIREERKFASLTALARQIKKDILQAKKRFSLP